jgi:L-threonylcarbamoyladenylate synthase
MIRLPFTDSREIKSAVVLAAEVVAAGGVILLPTESHYGLGVDPRQGEAVEKVFLLKGRPEGLALPVACSDWDQVESLIIVPDHHRSKLARIWPAALTVVAPCRRPVAVSTTDTLAVRIPDHDGLRALLYRVGPLTITSANRHGEPPCPTVETALDSLLGAPDLVLDAGDLAGGPVSTLMDLGSEDVREIRSGPVLWDEPFDLEDWVLQDG